ncbi:cache domain-containing sensor histidine kinase [Paenibacillus arenilitoris]|uniref:Sensor histidine kinase n=1 Tax=Paenibacillus arenilitoris TaxID=2772299 RepID=A0A927CMF4_9BACL|nr:sensor histidine kinase [Paenibacillus arenilitoris]MBD2868851.1 sensor histidine kinase [Paenibacillus arenilitoris]
MRFRSRLLISYLFLILLPLLALGTLFYRTSLNVVREQAQTNILEIVRKNNEVLDTKLQQIEKGSRALFVDAEMFAIFESLNPARQDQLLVAERRVKAILSKYFSMNDDIYMPQLWTTYFTFGGDSTNRKLPMSDPTKSAIYKQTMESDGKMVWTPTFEFSRMFDQPYLSEAEIDYRYMFSASRLLNLSYLDSSTFRTLDKNVERPALVILFKADMFRSLFERSIPEGSDYFVVDEAAGTVVAHSDGGMVAGKLGEEWVGLLSGSGTKRMELDGEKKLVVYDRSSVTGWLSVAVVPESVLIGGLVPTLLTSTFLFAALLGIIAIAFAYVISARIIGPIKKLLVAMRFVGEGDFHTRVEATSNDEFGTLLQKFNKMNDRIQTLVKENYEIKLREKEAEIVALNMQMNPHFLYNTLNVINWMAIEEGQREVSKSLVSLSSMLHYTSRKDWGEVSLAEELEWMKNYFYITALRFEDMFNVSYELEPELFDYKVPRLLFQPFVENAILHGFKEVEEGGLIAIRGRIADGIRRFEIEDNGKGMSGDVARRLLEGEAASVGISNTLHRIRLQYGERARIDIASSPGQGTLIRLDLPVNSQE